MEKNEQQDLLPTVVALTKAVTILLQQNEKARALVAVCAETAYEDHMAVSLSDEQIEELRQLLTKLGKSKPSTPPLPGA